MAIRNDRENKDIAGIYSEYWTDYRTGKDKCVGPNERDYPNEFTYPYKGRNNDYFLAGDEKNPEFKAKKIEFFRFKVSKKWKQNSFHYEF